MLDYADRGRCSFSASVSLSSRLSRYCTSPAPTCLCLTTTQRSLETFYGIGPKISQRIMARFHIHPFAKVGSLKNATVLDLTAELSEMKIENDARREVQDNIRRLKDMGTYRGRRHAMGLPVRGQRTRTQVRELQSRSCCLLLTMADCNGTKVEQDRTRWSWTNTDVKRLGHNHCIILYSKHILMTLAEIKKPRRNMTALIASFAPPTILSSLTSQPYA